MATTVTHDQRGLTTHDQRGFSLLETMIALAILAVVAAGVLPLGILAAKMSENQGHLAARTAEYAQDKVEQLMALAYTDQVSDTRVFPAGSSGGTGLKPGGSSNASAPVDLYVDYLDQSGNLCGSASATASALPCPAPSGTTPPNNWFYKRVWAIADSTTDGTLPTGLKRITVTATVAQGFGGAMKASSTLVVLKTSPF